MRTYRGRFLWHWVVWDHSMKVFERGRCFTRKGARKVAWRVQDGGI